MWRAWRENLSLAATWKTDCTKATTATLSQVGAEENVPSMCNAWLSPCPSTIQGSDLVEHSNHGHIIQALANVTQRETIRMYAIPDVSQQIRNS